MYPWDMTKETKETLDMLHDIQEIEAVLAAPWFDEQKAREIILKHNLKDPVVGAYNNNPATAIPLNMAPTSHLPARGTAPSLGGRRNSIASVRY